MKDWVIELRVNGTNELIDSFLVEAKTKKAAYNKIKVESDIEESSDIQIVIRAFRNCYVNL